MELPTYTNIWKIEKRLYKLYDFRLPMPLPVGQAAAFLAIAIPYMLILTMAGMPFSHTWVWLYVLPPGVLAWLVTRPVLEGKRLPELVLSQLRYLGEPRTWCRMTPLAEKDQITVVARVWRRDADLPQPALAAEPEPDASSATGPELAAAGPDEDRVVARPVWPTRPALTPRRPAPVLTSAAPEAGIRARATGIGRTAPAARPAAPVASAPATAPAPAPAAAPATTVPEAVQRPESSIVPEAAQRPESGIAPEPVAVPEPAPGPESAMPVSTRPTLTVRTDSTNRPLHVVERALRSAPDRTTGWRDHVVVVPGGHRPGKPDQVQRDQARVRLPLSGRQRIVVLGCTAGAGQSAIALLTGQVLTSLRGEPVAVLDLNPGPGSLTEQARRIARLLPGLTAAADSADPEVRRARGLQVVTTDPGAEQTKDAGQLIDAVVARYALTLTDPAAVHVPRAVQVADQLVLVAPASPDAAGALAMTLEWLEAHGRGELARRAVTVVNGVSEPTAAHADRAAAVAVGRCRAVVRVPWDGRLADGGALGTGAVQACTALAGVLVAGLTDSVTVPGAGR